MSRKHHALWRPTAADRALAARLGDPAAFVPVEGGFVGVRGGALELALAVWERFPGRAHAVLRRRIRRVGAVRDLDRAVAAVAARRVSEVAPAAGDAVPYEDLEPWLDRARVRAREARLDPGTDRIPDDVDAFVRRCVPAGVPGPLAARDRPVVAILVHEDRIVWAAHNAGGANRVLHAECALVLGCGSLPAGATLLVSLQPCRMCAALIVARAEGPVAVRWAEPDPGPLARDTATQRLGWEAPIRR